METKVTAAPPRWASYAEAQRLYGLSRWTLWTLLKGGHIRAARVGRRVLIDCASVDDYLASRVE